jgi:hypothetical protein
MPQRRERTCRSDETAQRQRVADSFDDSRRSESRILRGVRNVAY